MFSFLKKIFGSAPAATPAVDSKVEAINAAPYKVEAPVLTEVVAPKVEVAAPKAAAKKAKAPAKPKAVAAKKPAAKKPAVKKPKA